MGDATNGGRSPLSVPDAETVLYWGKQIKYPGLRASPNDVTGNHPGTQWDGKPHIHLPGTGRGGHVPVDPGVTPIPRTALEVGGTAMSLYIVYKVGRAVIISTVATPAAGAVSLAVPY